MLYIFQVDTGCMLTLETLNNQLPFLDGPTLCRTLQSSLPQFRGTPPSSLVLLVSGGAALSGGTSSSSSSSPPSTITTTTTTSIATNQIDSSPHSSPTTTTPLAGYSDTNPIFLFNKSNIESCLASPSLPFTQIITQMAEIEESLQVEVVPSYGVLVAMAKQSQGLFEQAREVVTIVESLVRDQHLMHLGWGSVVANLEDVVGVVRRRLDIFRGVWGGFSSRGRSRGSDEGLLPFLLGNVGSQEDEENDLTPEEWVEKLSHTLSTLHIPSSPSQQTLLSYLNNQQSTTPTPTPQTPQTPPPLLSSLPSELSKHAEILDPPTITSFLDDAAGLLEKAENGGMKEIGGLSERLFSLDQLLEKMRKTFAEFNDLNASLQKNTARGVEGRDPSILPDLCASHRTSLQLLLQHSSTLSSLHRRTHRAKEELLGALLSRLRWTILIQRQLSDLNLKLTLYNESVRRMRNLRAIARQLAAAPALFNAAAAETTRRAVWAEKYNGKLRKFKKRLETLRKKEVAKRGEFWRVVNSSGCYGDSSEDVVVGEHFLGAIFPCLLLGEEEKGGFGLLRGEGGVWEEVDEGGFGCHDEEGEKNGCHGDENENEKDEIEIDSDEEHSNEIESLKTSYESRIATLESNHQAAILSLQESHRNELDALKSRIKLIVTRQQDQEVAWNRGGNFGYHGDASSTSVAMETAATSPTTTKDDDEENEEIIPDWLIPILPKFNWSNSLKIGDPVLAIFSNKYGAFVLYSGRSGGGGGRGFGGSNKTPHFVHINGGGSSGEGDYDREKAYVGTLVDKEYCVARRANNRYRVPVGFHFYRVKLVISQSLSPGGIIK